MFGFLAPNGFSLWEKTGVVAVRRGDSNKSALGSIPRIARILHVAFIGIGKLLMALFGSNVPGCALSSEA